MTGDTNDLRERARLAAAGDREALESLLVHYLPQVRAFVRLRSDATLRARESSSDLVQSVCREVLRHGERFTHPDEEGFRRWLFTTALRKVRDHRDFHLAARRDARRELKNLEPTAERALLEAYSGVLTPSRAAVAREELERVERAMDNLSDEQREVLTMSRIAGQSHAAIAAHLDKSEGAVRMILHRALAKLVTDVERGGGTD